MSLPTIVVLAPANPRHLHRLVAAVRPLPVFLHADAATPDTALAATLDDLPQPVRLLLA